MVIKIYLERYIVLKSSTITYFTLTMIRGIVTLYYTYKHSYCFSEPQNEYWNPENAV